ncbi:hypothetical protein FRC12_009639 [Ceratobasidium sp. 428]|nr:hypothetical protein FRC12_009639 [Ceratobasidium sp. 428]
MCSRSNAWTVESTAPHLTRGFAGLYKAPSPSSPSFVSSFTLPLAMLFLRAALTLSALSSAIGAPPPAKRTYSKYIAKAEVENKVLGIHAFFEFSGAPGEPTHVKISDIRGLTNDPSLGGPFPYHIHTNAIPPDGNCTKALAHLDPNNVTEGYICPSGSPEYCQTGDLSGKHGKMNGTDSGKIDDMSYDDDFARYYPRTHSLLGRSIVIHANNKTRLACGNIYSPLDGTADRDFNPTGKPSNYVTDYPKVAPVQPSPAVVPWEGTKKPGQDVIEALPYPFPYPAYSIVESPNIKLKKVTHKVKYNNTYHTITQPKEYKSNAGPPFKGWHHDD